MILDSLARKAIKTTALPLGVGARARTGDLIVLLYHRVGDGDREIDQRASTFERQMATLSARRCTGTLDRALGGDDRVRVVVTVDDGYRDFHDSVLPLVVRYQVPVLLYLASGLVNGDGARDPSEPPRLTWSQLGEAVDTGFVTVGAHTHSHVDLSRAPEHVADGEMRRCKDLIEDRLGVPCRHFAYPWAVAGPEADRVARRLFDSAAVGWATNRAGRFDPHRLGRTPVLRNDGAVFFGAKVRGMMDAEAFAYRILRRGPWRRP
jgi:hypothetical protein